VVYFPLHAAKLPYAELQVNSPLQLGHRAKLIGLAVKASHIMALVESAYQSIATVILPNWSYDHG